MEARQAIIQATEQEYAKLRAAIDGLSEGQMSEVWLGTWGVLRRRPEGRRDRRRPA
jgi:hypothetical protein